MTTALFGVIRMSKRLSKKRKASLKVRVEEMNLAKSKHRSCDSSEGPSTSLPTETTIPSLVNESFELPVPLEMSERQ